MDKTPYQHDQAERTMVHRIINVCIAGGGHTVKNYDKAYSFIESNLGGQLWGKYYDFFNEYDLKFCGPPNKHRSRKFNKEAVPVFRKWERGVS